MIVPLLEILSGAALFAREVEADAEDEDEINGDDGDVDRGERPVRDCDSCGEEHRASVDRHDGCVTTTGARRGP